MTSTEDGVEHPIARTARKILTYAGALIEGRASIDLLALEQRYEGSLFIDLPISDGVVAPLEVGLHRSERTAALKREARYLAKTVEDYASKAPDILRDAERMLSACEDFARQAREAGAPITIGRIRMEPERSEPGSAWACLEVDCCFPAPTSIRHAGGARAATSTYNVRPLR